MRKIAVIFILLCGAAGAQDLPDHNKKILQFVDDNYGERVGQGVCSELVVGAIHFADTTYSDSVMDPFEIDISQIMPGDIILFDSTLFSDGTMINAHIAIVYHVKPGGLISVAEQNVATKEDNETEVMYRGRKVMVENDSRVAFSLVDLSQQVGGKIYLYRF